MSTENASKACLFRKYTEKKQRKAASVGEQTSIYVNNWATTAQENCYTSKKATEKVWTGICGKHRTFAIIPVWCMTEKQTRTCYWKNLTDYNHNYFIEERNWLQLSIATS